MESIVNTVVQGSIDFHGQRLADTLTQAILIISALVGFIVGFALQDIRYTVFSTLVGVGIAVLIVVPPWPFYTAHPVKFQASQKKAAALTVEEKKEERKGAKIVYKS
ncbi:hypothetical protein YB2330_003466 [Saitoella coloradoensis]